MKKAFLIAACLLLLASATVQVKLVAKNPETEIATETVSEMKPEQQGEKSDSKSADKKPQSHSLEKARTLFVQGRAAYETKRYADAKPILEKFVEKFPHHDQLQYVLYYLGDIALKNDNLDEAQHYFTQSVKMYPKGERFEQSVAGLDAAVKNTKKDARLKENTVWEIEAAPRSDKSTREVMKETSRRNYDATRTEVEAMWKDGTTKFDQFVDAKIRLIAAEYMLRAYDPEAKIEPAKPLPIAELLERYKNRNEALADPAYRELIVRWMNTAEETLRRQFQTVVVKVSEPTEGDFRKDVYHFYDSVFELYEILCDRPAMQMVLSMQTGILHQLRKKAIDVERPYFMELLEMKDNIANALKSNTNRLTRIVPVGTVQVSTALEHPLDFWRKRMILKHKDYLETEIKYLNGAQGGRIVDREKARLGWLETRVDYGFFSADLTGLRIAGLLREESAKHYRQAAEAMFKAGVVEESVVKEAAMEAAEAPFAPNSTSIQDIAALEKGELDPKGRPTVLCLKIVPLGPPSSRRAANIPTPDKPVIPSETLNNYTNALVGTEKPLQMKKDSGTQSPARDPDYVKLLEKRVELSKQYRDQVEAMFKSGAAGGSAQAFYTAQMQYAGHRADLYKYLGDREKHLAALKDKLEAAKQKHQSRNAGYKVGTATLDQLIEAELDAVEAEYELKQAEKATGLSLSPWLEMTSTSETRQFKINHAKTAFEVAQAELALLEETNRRHPGAISDTEIEKAKRKVATFNNEPETVSPGPGTQSPARDAKRYHVKPGDTISIIRSQLVPKSPYRLRTGDQVALATTADGRESGSSFTVKPDGKIVLKNDLGSIEAEGLTVEEFQEKLAKHLSGLPKKPEEPLLNHPVSVKLARLSDADEIEAGHQVGADGYITLGSYGRVYVEGLTTEECIDAVKFHLSKAFENPQFWLGPKKAGTQSPAREGKKELTFQGKTFEQWVEELKTELDPKMRGEAFRALAMFGANGRGKEATETIVEAVKGVNFNLFSTDHPLENMKLAATIAFTDNALRIPFKDSLPILMKNFKDGSANAQSFAKRVFSGLQVHEDAHLVDSFFRELMQWNIDGQDGRPYTLLYCMAAADPGGESMLRYLRDALEKNDAPRFRLPFSGLKPASLNGRYLRIGEEDWSTPLGLFPCTVDSTAKLTGRGRMLENPRLSTFGKALLQLLKEKGVTSENETIRETSKKVVEALEAVDP